MAVILLAGGPHTTVWTLIILASIVYLVFWALGAFKMVAARRVKPVDRQPLPPMSWQHEQVIGTLKVALTQGRLTKDEHDARAGLASAARSRAELGALTADLLADLAARRPTTRDAWTGVCMSFAVASVLAALLLWQPDDFLAFATALFAAATVLLAPPITVGLMADVRHQKQAGEQLRLGPAPSAGR